MENKIAKKIIDQYGKDWFKITIEDTSFGDGSCVIGFNTIFDSVNEAKEVADAIQTLIIGKTIKHIIE